MIESLYVCVCVSIQQPKTIVAQQLKRRYTAMTSSHCVAGMTPLKLVFGLLTVKGMLDVLKQEEDEVEGRSTNAI